MTDEFLVVDTPLTADGQHLNFDAIYMLPTSETCDACRPPSATPSHVEFNPIPLEIEPPIELPQHKSSDDSGTLFVLVSLGLIACVGFELCTHR